MAQVVRLDKDFPHQHTDSQSHIRTSQPAFQNSVAKMPSASSTYASLLLFFDLKLQVKHSVEV